MNFINLETQTDPVLEIVLLPILVNVPEENNSEGCIQKSCKINVGCNEDFFAIKNLFSELTDDWQRAIIRQNLGIGDDATLLWGKIQGNLANQLDLTKFIREVAGEDSNEIIQQLNLKLKYWTQLIENKIESLASNITSLEVIPQYAIPNLLPVNVLVNWTYDLPVEQQAINGVVIDPEVRNYIFENVNDTIHIRLSYFYNNVWLSRNINFEVTFPIYYGTSANYEDNNYTIGNLFKVTTEEGLYIYIMSKNAIDISVGGIIGGFELIGIINIASSRYILYKSANPNLGETIIRIYDQE